MRELFVGLLLWMVIPAGLVAAQEDAPKSDAEYVVEQLASSELFEVSMEAMGDLLAQSIDLELRKSDKLLSPDSLAWISDQMGVQMGAIMVDVVKDDYISAYSTLYSPEVLAELRAFLETPAGQEFAINQPKLVREAAAIGIKHGESIATEAAEIVIGRIQNGEFPADMATTTQRELSELFTE